MIFIKHTGILDGSVAVVEIAGPLNRDTSPDLEDYINELLEKEIRFILFDFHKIKYVSSEGIGVILYIQKKISDSGGFLITFNLPDEIRSLYSLLGFDKVIRIAESRAEAIQVMDRQIELKDSGQSIIEPGAGKLVVDNDMEEEISVADEDIAESDEVMENEIEIDRAADAEQFVIECEKCGALIRIRQSGTFLCPECKTEFSVSDDHSVSFKLV